jgi:hypothetical protein
MALTTAEKNIVHEMIGYYVTTPDQLDLLYQFIEDDETTKRNKIKAYLTNVKRPQIVSGMESLQDSYNELNVKLTQLDNYVNG